MEAAEVARTVETEARWEMDRAESNLKKHRCGKQGRVGNGTKTNMCLPRSAAIKYESSLRNAHKCKEDKIYIQ